MPFYKKQDGQLQSGEFIDGQGYTLSEAGKDEHTYPIDGWYWFADLDSAMAGMSTPTNSVSMRQAQLALLQHNLLDAVDSAILQMPREAQIEWNKATEVQRDNPLVPAMQTLLGWTDEQMDGLFTLAATL